MKLNDKEIMDDLLKFLDKSVSMYHSTLNSVEMLKKKRIWKIRINRKMETKKTRKILLSSK